MSFQVTPKLRKRMKAERGDFVELTRYTSSPVGTLRFSYRGFAGTLTVFDFGKAQSILSAWLNLVDQFYDEWERLKEDRRVILELRTSVLRDSGDYIDLNYFSTDCGTLKFSYRGFSGTLAVGDFEEAQSRLSAWLDIVDQLHDEWKKMEAEAI